MLRATHDAPEHALSSLAQARLQRLLLVLPHHKRRLRINLSVRTRSRLFLLQQRVPQRYADRFIFRARGCMVPGNFFGGKKCLKMVSET